MKSNKFQLSLNAKYWMRNTSVSKHDEAAALNYLSAHGAPADTVEQMHHILNISNPFPTRSTWLEDLIGRTKSPVWRLFAVNKCLSARIIYVATEHKARQLGNTPAVWAQLIADAIKKFPL